MNTTATLRSLAEKEQAKTPFSAADNTFLQQLVEFYYDGTRNYTGWYPMMFYKPRKRNCSKQQQRELRLRRTRG